MKPVLSFILALLLGGCAQNQEWKAHPQITAGPILKPESFALKTQQQAVLLIEFQKSWTQEGFFHWLISDELEERKVLEHTRRLIREARNNNILIIHAPLILDKSQPEHYKKTPLPARLFNQFTKNTWKEEFVDSVYQPQDLVAQGRYGFDATEGSDLLEILKSHKIQQVFVGGFTTDHCVLETMITLEQNGYDSYMVPELTAARNSSIQSEMESQLDTISTERLISLWHSINPDLSTLNSEPDPSPSIPLHIPAL
jgi:nicotinamidase-related amidase